MSASSSHVSLIVSALLVVCLGSLVLPMVESRCYNFFTSASRRDLATCQWYNSASCCTVSQSEEIDKAWKQSTSSSNATIPNFLRSITGCLDELHMFICYQCAPNNGDFIDTRILAKDRLNICADYCDRMYSKCGFAITADGSLVRNKYASGREFCLEGLKDATNLEINVATTGTCFSSSPSFLTTTPIHSLHIVIMALSCLIFAFLI